MVAAYNPSLQLVEILEFTIFSLQDLEDTSNPINFSPRSLYYFVFYSYGNQQLIRYRVQCPSDHFSFFNLMSLDLEPPSCSDDTGRTR